MLLLVYIGTLHTEGRVVDVLDKKSGALVLIESE